MEGMSATFNLKSKNSEKGQILVKDAQKSRLLSSVMAKGAIITYDLAPDAALQYIPKTYPFL